MSTVDAEKAREKLPSTDSAEKYGKDLGKEAGSTVDDAVSTSLHSLQGTTISELIIHRWLAPGQKARRSLSLRRKAKTSLMGSGGMPRIGLVRVWTS